MTAEAFASANFGETRKEDLVTAIAKMLGILYNTLAARFEERILC
jgi:hypothetical protein